MIGGAGAFAPACRGLAFRESLPSGARCGLSVRPLHCVCLGKFDELCNGFSLARCHARKGGFFVCIGDAGGCLGFDFLTDYLNRKVERIGVTIGTCAHSKSNFGNGGCSLDRERDLARARLWGYGGRVGHAPKIQTNGWESIAERKKIVFFSERIFAKCEIFLTASPISRKNCNSPAQPSGGGHFPQSPLPKPTYPSPICRKRYRSI